MAAEDEAAWVSGRGQVRQGMGLCQGWAKEEAAAEGGKAAKASHGQREEEGLLAGRGPWSRLVGRGAGACSLCLLALGGSGCHCG